MITLNQEQHALCWKAGCDSHQDYYDRSNEALHARLAILPEADQYTYRQCYAAAYAAVEGGCGVSGAQDAAGQALAELAVVAGVG